MLLVPAALLLVAAVFGFFRARTAYKAQRLVLAELAKRECAVFIEYPGPDAIWTAVQWLASPRYSAAEVAQFLDASIGTAVYMQCQTRPIPTLPRLPGLLAIDVMMDAEGTANGSDAEESQRGRLTAGNLPRLARVSLGGVGNDSGVVWDVIELPHLRFLKISLSRLGVDDSGEHFLQRLHLLTQLEALEIESCEVGSRLVSLKELRNLRVLSLWGTTFDTKTSGTEPDLVRETLRQIGSLPRLEKLRLTGKSVDDGGVAQIAGLSSLRSLELYDNGITAAAGRSLAPARPAFPGHLAA